MSNLLSFMYCNKTGLICKYIKPYIVRFSHSANMNTNHLYPTDFFEEKSEKRIALLLLNGPPDCGCVGNRLKSLWAKSHIQICADGGANRLRQVRNVPEFIPKIICGDLDSCDKENIEYYKQKGAEIVKIVDDETTDFTKSVNMLKQRIHSDVHCAVVLGGLCGRFDHVLGCLQTLYLAKLNLMPSLPFYLIHNESLVCLIPKGESQLHVNRKFCTGKCGLVPFGYVADRVTTNGLRWNLANQCMAYGGLISTSNELESDTIVISTDSVLLWTMELN